MTKSVAASICIDSAVPRLRRATLVDLVCGIEQGSITAKQLVETYSARVGEVSYEFRAVIEINPDALEIAQALDLECSTGNCRGSLHGMPILLKDNIPTRDKTDTACGSLALAGARPAKEAEVVTALRKAGAVILGKANMAEWSGFRSTSGCSGWSARGGQTKGIFYPSMKASGSSGGGAVAVALGLCAAAIDMLFDCLASREIRYHRIQANAKFNIFEGINDASKRLDTVGLLTRSVFDAVQILLELIYQSNYRALQSKVKAMQGIRLACSEADLTGVRIGVPSHLSDFKTLHKQKFEAFERALGALERFGATIVHNVIISGADEYEALSSGEKQIILDTDMKIAINSYLSTLTRNPNNVHSLQSLINFTKSCPEEEYPLRNVEGFERAQATYPDGDLYRKMIARDEYFAGEGGIESALNRHRCDVLLVPTLSVTLQTFAAKVGSPVMSVPIGSFSEDAAVEVDAKNRLINIAPGIPFSAYIFGRATKDEDVLRVRYVLAQITKVGESLRPYLEPNTELVDV